MLASVKTLDSPYCISRRRSDDDATSSVTAGQGNRLRFCGSHLKGSYWIVRHACASALAYLVKAEQREAALGNFAEIRKFQYIAPFAIENRTLDTTVNCHVWANATSILDPLQSHFQVVQPIPPYMPIVQEASDDDAVRYALLIGKAVYLRYRECAFGAAMR